MMHYYYPDFGYGFGIWGVLGGIIHILFWIFLIIFIVRVIRRGRHKDWRHHMWGEKGALEILRERYAKGEINKTEFEEKKKDLEAK